MNNKLFVGSLAWSVTDEALKKAFEPHGEVVSARVVQDRQTGRSRGFGFVEFADASAAEAAIKAMDQQELEGRTINVSEAQSKE